MPDDASPEIIVGKTHLALPTYVYVLPATDAEFIHEIRSAGFQERRLDFSRPLEVRDGDIFCLQVSAVAPEHVPYLEEVARIGFERSSLVILPFAMSAEDGINSASMLRARFEPELIDGTEGDIKASYFLEYQTVVWDSLTAIELREAIVTAHIASNWWRIRAGLFTVFGSLFAMFNGLFFGAGSTIALLVLLICHGSGFDVAGWRPLIWFLAGPAFAMMFSVSLNLVMKFNLAVGIWFAAEWIVNGGGIGNVAIPAILGMAAFFLANRLHEAVDMRDLLTCVFDRDINHANPQFEVHEKAPKIGGGEFILWRLNLPVWRLFSTRSLSRIFISHRNSPSGIEVSTWLHDELVRTGQWTAFLDRKHLSGGLWRDQLADGFGGRGVLLCVLTAEDQDKLRWVRRELYAACLKYRCYGTPVPVIIESGMTVDELMESEENEGRFNTPVHRIQDRLTRITLTSRNRHQFVGQLTRAIKAAISKEASMRAPLFLKRGITGIAEQLWDISFLVVVLAAFGIGAQSPTLNAVLMIAMVVLATDFGGSSVSKLLPSWAGGMGLKYDVISHANRGMRHPIESSVILGTIMAVLTQRSFDASLWVALLIGLSLNIIDHELWQAARLSEYLVRDSRSEV